jgi:hypothetical protein
MTFWGWVFMLSSTLSVTALVVWCFYRVLGAPEEPAEEVKHFHSA